MVLVHGLKLELGLVSHMMKQLRLSQTLTGTNGSVFLYKPVQLSENFNQIHGFCIVSYSYILHDIILDTIYTPMIIVL